MFFFNLSGRNSCYSVVSVPLFHQILKHDVVQKTLQRPRLSMGRLRFKHQLEDVSAIRLIVQFIPKAMQIQIPRANLCRRDIRWRFGRFSPPQSVGFVKVLLAHEINFVAAQQWTSRLPGFGCFSPSLVYVIHLNLSAHLPGNSIQDTSYMVLRV